MAKIHFSAFSSVVTSKTRLDRNTKLDVLSLLNLVIIGAIIPKPLEQKYFQSNNNVHSLDRDV